MEQNPLNSSIEYLKGVGPTRATILKTELNIYTFKDLIEYFPYRYIDKSKFYKTNEITSELTHIQLKGKIISTTTAGNGRNKRFIALFSDGLGSIELIWFNGVKWLSDYFQKEIEYIIFGKPNFFNNKISIIHPEIDIFNEESKEFLKIFQPLYNTTEKARNRGIDNKSIGKLVYNLIPQIKGYLEETLSADIIEQYKLMSREEALINIHYPSSQEHLQKAERRLKFEELFYNQLRLIRLKLIRTKKIRGHIFDKVGINFNNFYKNNLPFELTNAQKKVIKEIHTDMKSGKQMNRLVQGDVGSGKTLVALMCMLLAIDNDSQSCIMAPTEILAQQHFETIKKFLNNLNVNIELLTGSTRLSKRHTIHSGLLDGSINIIIGTHALIEDVVQFKNLGLVVIDEQHRFGVSQRAKLWKKNSIPPHILVMTATPIPRTLAMTLYGDLDISVIDELPAGRKPIITKHFFDTQRLKIIGFMKNQIESGRQIYVVYPLITESETLDLKHLEDGYEQLSREFPLPEFAISIVHGKMKSKEKEFEMNRFIKGETQIMVATTVIEVGVDVSNASVMIIEDAQRFGLTQLHQLRGRVGRGAEQSFCILVSNFKLSNDAKKRLEAMVRTNDGFEIANLDLQLRGPGDIEGTQQSGIIDLKIADIVKDEKILIYARKCAIEIIEKDSELQNEKNLVIAKNLKSLISKKGNWGIIS